MWTDVEIKGKILHKLTRFGKLEHSHTAIEHLQKRFPNDLVGRVKKVIDELKREGVLKSKLTGYGEQIAINVEKTDDVMKYIEAFLKMKS